MRFHTLLLVALLVIPALAELPMMKAEVTDAGFPKNEGAEFLYWFGGCNDCSGPWEATVSGSLEPQEGNLYSSEALQDNNFLTCWATSGGVGSWFAFTSWARIPIRGFSIVNGYTKSPKRWAQNSRIKLLELSIAGKPTARIELEDTPSVQTFKVPEFRLEKGEQFRFRVLSVYPGSVFDDLCVSEFQINAGH